MTYTDILESELTQHILDCIEESEGGFRHNLDGLRIIIKWIGDMPECIADLNPTPRTNQEMITYISNPANGWQEAPLT